MIRNSSFQLVILCCSQSFWLPVWFQLYSHVLSVVWVWCQTCPFVWFTRMGYPRRILCTNSWGLWIGTLGKFLWAVFSSIWLCIVPPRTLYQLFLEFEAGFPFWVVILTVMELFLWTEIKRLEVWLYTGSSRLGSDLYFVRPWLLGMSFQNYTFWLSRRQFTYPPLWVVDLRRLVSRDLLLLLIHGPNVDPR